MTAVRPSRADETFAQSVLTIALRVYLTIYTGFYLPHYHLHRSTVTAAVLVVTKELRQLVSVAGCLAASSDGPTYWD